MSIQVNDFQWEPGKNDTEYIKLLELSRDEWQKIAQKAITKLKTLSKTQEPRILSVEEIKNLNDGDVVWIEYSDNRLLPMIVENGCLNRWKYILRICKHMFYDDDYMSRAWSARPTDKQREATPWN